MNKKKEYPEYLKNLKEVASIKLDDGEELEITFAHQPNVVGKRSKFTGLPIWVGETVAHTNGQPKIITVTARCQVNEPFTYTHGRHIASGKILKEMGLPIELANQVGEYSMQKQSKDTINR